MSKSTRVLCPACKKEPPGIFLHHGSWLCADHNFKGAPCPGSQADVTAAALAVGFLLTKPPNPQSLGPLFEWVPAPAPTALDTISSAKEEYQASLPGGVICPCCERYGKSYRRKLNSGMALALTWIVCHSESKRGGAAELPWVDVPAKAPRKVLASSRDFTILRYWGLIQRPTVRINGREHTKHPGLWRPTTKGVAFVRGQAGVPSHAIVYNDCLRSLDGSPVTIQQALGQRFDYAELIAEWGAAA